MRKEIATLLTAVLFLTSFPAFGQQQSAAIDQVWKLTSDPILGVKNKAWYAVDAMGCDGVNLVAERGGNREESKDFLIGAESHFTTCAQLSDSAWTKFRAALSKLQPRDLFRRMEALKEESSEGETPAAKARRARVLKIYQSLIPVEVLKQLVIARNKQSRLRVGGSVAGTIGGLYASTTSMSKGMVSPVGAGDRFQTFTENDFFRVVDTPRSTISTDVDGASLSLSRHALNRGEIPESASIRIEEWVNYYRYTFPKPEGNRPIGVGVEFSDAPWNPSHRLVKIGIKAKEIQQADRKPANLVFLVDTSGSMQPADRLPLLKEVMINLAKKLNAKDRVAIVSYAGSHQIDLESTPGNQHEKIIKAIESLASGGGTNGEAGLKAAYELARKGFVKGGINRIIIGTDGDFNIGDTSTEDLTKIAAKEAKNGIAITVLGFGVGNLRDELMQHIAQSGDGNAYYIDSSKEGERVFGAQLNGTLQIVAKDVKLQVEFNPAVIGGYRLIGYETRLLQAKDFKDDSKDAGDMGAGDTVTVMYELVPVDSKDLAKIAGVDPLRYLEHPKVKKGKNLKEALFVDIRYKDPEGGASKELSTPAIDTGAKLADASSDLLFASGVATLGMVLRKSKRIPESVGIETAEALVKRGASPDPDGYRAELIGLIGIARKVIFLDDFIEKQRAKHSTH